MKSRRTLFLVLGLVTFVVLMRFAAPLAGPLFPVVLVVLIAAFMALIVFYWRGIDEAAREAQKTAWLWGGTGGTMAWALLVLLVPPFREWSVAALPGQPGDPADAYLSGAMSVLILQSAGFLLHWLGWWAVRR